MRDRITNFIIGAILLLFAFGIMAFFPVETNLLTFVIIFVSAFAFCIGYFRLGIAIDLHHASPMMAKIAALREKYDLHMRAERYMDAEAPDTEERFIRK